MSLSDGTIIKIAAETLLPDDTIAINVIWGVVSDNGGSGSVDEADVLDAAAAFVDNMFQNLETRIPTGIDGGLVNVWTVAPATGDLTPIGDEALTWTGSSAQDPFPNGVAAVGSAKTTNTDVTGRKFIPGLNEQAADDNNLTAASLTAILAYLADWVTVFVHVSDVIITPGVYSYTDSNFYLFTGVIVANAILGYQRRRKPGVGT